MYTLLYFIWELFVYLGDAAAALVTVNQTMNSHRKKPLKVSKTGKKHRVQATTTIWNMLSREFHDNILTEDQLRDVQVIRKLGEGGNGLVDLVHLEGRLVVRKTLKKVEAMGNLVEEVRIHKMLAGAGGAPLLQGLCLTPPPRMFISWAGTSYTTYLRGCSERDVVSSLIIIAEKLTEIHEKNVVHNDLKADNITAVTTEGEVDFNVIDFGLSKMSGDILYINGDRRRYHWMAPEVLAGQPCLPASDVYSYGALMHVVQ